MSSSAYSLLLDKVLRAVARRYRVPMVPSGPAATQQASPAAALAIVIEQARAAVVRGEAPDKALKHTFIAALARLIHQAMHAEQGDPAFQAMVMRHRLPRVREYASLAAHAAQDRRSIRSAVGAIAHPAKERKLYPDSLSQALARLYAAASQASWTELADIAGHLLLMPEACGQAGLERCLRTLLDDPALGRLSRLQALSPDELVQRHQALLDRHTHRAGSPEAAAQGRGTQQRGAAMEASAAQALETLARRFNQLEAQRFTETRDERFSQPEESPARYRVVTSMRVPASIPGNAERAKTEWDAVLLRRAYPVGTVPASADGGNADADADAEPAWDVCLLVEAKASVDAATTDLPRLLRGLRLLAQAEQDTVYSFATQQGTVRLRGASLRALTFDGDDLPGTVLYCCDAPADTSVRLLSAASRMQLLSAPASLAFASRLAENPPPAPEELGSVWRELLESPRWHPVLRQYATLRQARELMVHPADLAAAADATDRISRPGHGRRSA